MYPESNIEFALCFSTKPQVFPRSYLIIYIYPITMTDCRKTDTLLIVQKR